MKFRTMAMTFLSLFTVSIATPSVLNVKVLADEISVSEHINVLEDNDEIRKVEEFSVKENQYITYTYHKKTGFLDIEKNGRTESHDVVSIGLEQLSAHNIGGFRASNSSMFSAWSYSSSGNRYTLRINHISYGANPVSKTVTRSGRNSGYIDAFMANIDDLRNAEMGVLGAAGWQVASAVIGAAITGGIGAVTAISGVAAVVQAAKALPPIYDRALYNYNNVR